MSNWIVYAENSVYWNVGELVENPPDWGEAHMRSGEIALKPICRVCKTAGRHVLDLILAAGDNRKETT